MKTIYFLITLIVVFFISCEKESVSDTFSLGLEKDFKINSDYHSTDNSIKFSITNINDSRCPSDVTCIWAGKADVTIDVESPVKGNLVLSTIENNIDQKIDTLGNYSFQLIDVSPYPVSTETIHLEDYKVTLKILEL